MSQHAPILSVVSPVYQGKLLVEKLVRRIADSMLPLSISYEIILIDDGSTDATIPEIEKMILQFPALKAIILDKNYGQHNAIRAGLEQAAGEWVVVMDCDGQDPPEMIPVFYQKAITGFDAVFASRNKSADPFLKKMYSSLFYRLLNSISGVRLNGSTANFGIYNRSVIQEILRSDKVPFFFPVVARKAATHSDMLIVDHAKRMAGKTTYSFTKALQLACRVIAGYTVFSLFIRKSHRVYSIKQIIQSK